MGVMHMREDAVRHAVVKEAPERVMIVGDVHGCCDELEDLLRLHHREGDLLILAGDLVNKGPKSVEVVQLARRMNAMAVVGNHEISSLRGYFARSGGRVKDVEEKYAWTDQLSIEDVDYIRSLPFTITIPSYNVIVVHAGLVPDLSLAEQDHRHMVTMRNVRIRDEAGACRTRYEALELDDGRSEPWAAMWKGPSHVYFGHDAKRRLQRYKYATGLDTGCLYGDRLSAAILEQGKEPRIVSIKARKAYVEVDDGPSDGLMFTSNTLVVLGVGILAIMAWNKMRS